MQESSDHVISNAGKMTGRSSPNKAFLAAIVFLALGALFFSVFSTKTYALGPAFVQGSSTDGYNVSTISVKLNSTTVAAGDILAADVYVSHASSTLNSITATCVTGNFTLVNNPTIATSSASDAAMGYGIVSTASSSCKITATLSAPSVAAAALAVHEITGVSTSSPLDVSAMNVQASPGAGANAVTSGNVTTTHSGDYLFGVTNNGSNDGAFAPTVGTGYTARQYDIYGMQTEDMIQGSSGSTVVTFTAVPSYATYITGIMAFKPTSSATPPSVAWVSPANNATVSSTISLTASSTDAVSVSSVAFYEGAFGASFASSTLIGSTSTASGTLYTIPWNTTSIANGSTTLWALSTDSSNNTSTASTTVNVGNLPSISSFSASPTVVASAGTSALSWNITNASSVAITPGSFSTSTLIGSTNVNPTSTTIYTITATNPNGSVTATTTVTVDNTTPTTPTGLTATSTLGTQVNLSWTASTDSGGSGIAGYNIFRCIGSCTPSVLIATSSGVSYTNAGLTASTTYTYAVSAYNAVGTVSATSTSATVTTLPPAIPADIFITMSSGTIGNLLTTSTLTAGTISSGTFTWTLSTTTFTGFTIGANQTSSALLAPVAVGGVQYSTSTTAQSMAYSDANNLQTAIIALPGTSQKVSYGGWITLGVPNDGVSSGLYDFIDIENAGTDYAVAQLRNGNNNLGNCPGGSGVGPNGYTMQIEVKYGGVTRSPCIVVTPNATYWVTLQNDAIDGLASMALYNTSGTQVGFATTTMSTGTAITDVRIGQDEVKTDPGYTNYFENQLINYSTGQFPLGPGTSTSTTGSPSISSFSASPTVVASAGTSALSWNITNASSVAITPGSFSTSTLIGSTNVNPTSTTIYTITATNPNGSVTATTTVNVATAPSAPGSFAVGSPTTSTLPLSWTSSTPNNGATIASYFIYRGIATSSMTQIATTTSLSFTDTGLATSATYFYYVTAHDSVGNVSASSSIANGTTASGSGSSTLWSGIIAPSRAVDWSTAGVTGGIPINRTQCGATITAYSGTAAAINTALQNCPANEYVQLGPGTFTLSTSIDFDGLSNVSLKGTGANQTDLVFTGNSGCLGAASSICMTSSDNNWKGGPTNLENWTAGYTKNTTAITLASVPNLKVGNPIILDQLDSTQDDGSILVTYSTSTLPFTSPGLAGPYSVSGNSGGAQRAGRQQEQIVTVTGCNGTTTPGFACSGSNVTVTISPGLDMPNWSASSSPQAWWATNPALYDGVENLTVDNTNNTGVVGVELFNCSNCWVKGIRGIDSARSQVQLQYAPRSTVQDSYFFLTQDSVASSYGWECYSGSDDLVQNNIFQAITSPEMFNGPCSGSVVGYNFSINDFYEGSAGYNINAHGDHTSGNDSALYEGNDGNIVQADAIHGTHNLITYFRNRLTGPQPACWASGTAYASATYEPCNNNLSPFILSAFSRFYNLIGNVLGTSGVNTTYMNSGSFPIYELGVGNGSVPVDPNVSTTVMLWGNYDTANAAVRFASSEVPSALSGTQAPYSNPVPATDALPASFYLSSAPAWWGSTPWPAVGPDVTGGNLSGVGGYANMNPAQTCYNSMGGNASGTGNVLAFDPTLCYPADFNTTSSAAVVWTAPTNDATVSSTVTLTASSSDVGASISSVGFYEGSFGARLASSTLVGSTSTAAGTLYSVPWSTVSVANGSTTLWAFATDTLNNTSTASMTVNVQNSPTINSFSASSTSIVLGSSSVLSWNALNASSILLSGNNLSLSTTTTAGTVSVTPNTTGTLIYTISATNANGTSTAQATVVVDNVPPSIPTNLSATAVSATEIDLSWASSTDNIGVAGYDIYQNGINIATTTTLSYANTGLSPSTSYTYTIDTFDGAGNASAQSSSTSATTQAQSSGGGGGGGTVSGGGGGGGTYIPASTSTTATSPLTGASSTSLGASDSMTELLSLIAEVRSLSLQLFLRGNNGSVLTVGSTGQDVWALQIYLINNNLLAPTGPAGSKLTTPTSYFGTLTKNALAEYQAQVGISPTSGILGAKTYGYLETVAGGKPSTSIVAPAAPVVTTVTKTTPAPVAATPSISSAVQTLSLGSTGSGVVTLQKILVKNGYLQAGIFANGTFDASTLRAVETFQCLENIVCSGLGYGVVGPRTRTALGM